MSGSKVIIIRESLAKSIIRDAITFGSMAAAIGLGVFLESTAMQWVGAVCWFISVIGRASGMRKEFTKDEAISYLQSDEGH